MNIQCLFCTKDRPCLLMRLFCRGILYRPRESMTTSRFYKLIEKCPASDYWQILKTNLSFSINWPGSLLFYFVLQYSYKIMLKNQTKPKGSAKTFWRSCKACIYHEIEKEVYNHQLLFDFNQLYSWIPLQAQTNKKVFNKLHLDKSSRP